MTDPANLVDRQTMFGNYLVAGWPSLGIPGIPAVSAASVVGNGTIENECRSVTIGPKDHGSDGILQWRDSASIGSGARLTNMKIFGTKYFGTWQALGPQAAFFAYETKGWYKSLWAMLVQGTKELKTLTADVCYYYENPNRALANLDGRIAAATTFYGGWKPQTPAPIIVASPVIPPTEVKTAMDPTVLIPLVEPLFVPLLEAVFAGIARGAVVGAGASTSASAPSTTTPALDLNAIVAQLAPLIAAELAKLAPPTGAKV